MCADDQNFTDLLDAYAQNLGKRQRVATSDGTRRPDKDHTPRSSQSSASMSSGSRDEELLRVLTRLSLRQKDALAQLSLDKNYIFFIQCSRGSIIPRILTKAHEWNQFKEKGGDHAASDDDISSLFSRVSSTGQAVEIGSKRRRLDSDFEVQRHFDGGSSLDLPHMGLSGLDAQAQQAPAFDLRGSSIPPGAHCPHRAAALGDPQVFSLAPSESVDLTTGCFGSNSLVPLLACEFPNRRNILVASKVVKQWNHIIDAPEGQIRESLMLSFSQCHPND